MKFEQGVEVSGLKKVVIDRKTIWRLVDGSAVWELGGNPNAMKSQEKMATMVKLMVLNPKRRAWVHGDTLNIVRKDLK